MTSTESKPLFILFLGPPGAGKGTHAIPLSQHLQIPHISTGSLLREHIRNQSPLGMEAQKYMGQGRLVPDQLVLEMLFERIHQPDCSQGGILDGFPRTIAQARILQNTCTNCRFLILHFEVSDSILIERITGRLVCKECTCSYHKIYDPPQRENLCDRCGSPLYTRDDDREEVLRKRLEVYRTQTAPLIDFYAEAVVEIDGENSKEQVFQDVLGAIPFPAAFKA